MISFHHHQEPSTFRATNPQPTRGFYEGIKFGVTDIELVERINDIDLSDGRLDGKVRKTTVACPKCNRTISQRFPQCMYCGQPIVHDPFA